ncbi:beta-N-acetylhexosaminidase [Aestuariibacter salexigens]|uniref:beta-N-acetylhexosaminidase n=1 Tax=Aestuariibacter salexigens TaxID=226010 RepID=UPI000426B1F7|nr:beta-N-acetylhexosaminidase [Aestuariibacter salexigens]
MGPVVIDLIGEDVSAEEKDMLEHPLVGGVILFSRNYAEPRQLTELMQQIREYARQDVLVCVDHEGGRVQRFKQGFTHIPAMGKLMPWAQQHGVSATQLATEMGWLMASELRAFDIDVSFAPVLDIWGNSDVIGDRSFHSDPKLVIELASAFIEGMRDAGMSATGKHFPGHGNVKEDSHIAMPVDRRSKDDILSVDMAIFSALHDKGQLDAVMPAHVIFPDVDEHPAGFSSTWLQGILRGQMGFDGVIFSDDLSMQAASVAGDHLERAKAAFAAGCDLGLVCNDSKAAAQVLDGLPSDFQTSDRARKLKPQNSVTLQQLHASTRWQQASELANRVQHG